MVAVELNFLAGKYHATPWGHHVNEGNVEWPPSLWRFLRALVSVWKTSCRDNISEERMINILDKLKAPPKYFVPPSTLAHTRHYMPIKEGRKEDRALVFDSFVSLCPGDSLFIIWDEVDLSSDELSVLGELLKHLNYLGRAESWCCARLSDNPPKANYIPCDEEKGLSEKSVELLIPSRNQKIDMEKLCARTSKLRGQGYLYPPGTELLTYIFQDEGTRKGKGVGTLPRKGETQLALYAVFGPVKPMMTEALTIAETVRAALQDHYGRLHGGQSSSLFSGKDEYGKPMQGHVHAYFLPLDEDRDGRIDHILVYRADGFGEGERMALARLEVLYPQGKGYPIQLGLLRLGTEEGLDVSVLRRSRTWESITPFMLVRHPHWKRGKDIPEEQLRLELQRKGFPEPISVESSGGYLRHRHVSWLDYKRFRARYKPAENYPYGFVIHFAEEVRGPIALGYACHFGLGLFIPLE